MISVRIHMSAFEHDYTIYRWNRRKYAPIDSYVCKFDREQKVAARVSMRDSRQ